MRKPVVVFGAGGLIGKAVTKYFADQGVETLGVTSQMVDLTIPGDVERFFQDSCPAGVINCAGVVGGIVSNLANGYDLGSINALIEVNVLNAARRAGIERLVNLGCGCCYPNNKTFPMTAQEIWSGPIEPSSRAYSLAKLLGIELVNQQRLSSPEWISVIPSNVYGPGDNFSPEHSHVIPAMIRRFILAKLDQGGPAKGSKAKSTSPDGNVSEGDPPAKSGSSGIIEFMGTGSAIRQFIHTDDVASAIYLVYSRADKLGPVVNIAGPETTSIEDLAHLTGRVVGYCGTISFSGRGSNGTPVKVLDGSALAALGWSPSFTLEYGLEDTLAQMRVLARQGELRGWDLGDQF